MIKGVCSVCGRTYQVEDRYAGLTGRCKACGALVTVPGEREEGLDGLPATTGGIEVAPPGAAEAAPERPQAPPQPQASQPKQAPSGPVPESGASAPSAHEPQAAGAPRKLDDPSVAHDARSRYEPSHGPTAKEGPWLREEPGAASPPREAQEKRSARADEVLASSRIVTTIAAGSEGGRPLIVVAACVGVGLLGLGFLTVFAMASTVGIIVGVIGLALGALGAARLWTAHWDGLVAAGLFCLLDIGVVLSLAVLANPEGQRLSLSPPALGLLAGGGLALLLILLAAALPSGRQHFASRG